MNKKLCIVNCSIKILQSGNMIRREEIMYSSMHLMYCETMLTEFLRGDHFSTRVIHFSDTPCYICCVNILFIWHCLLSMPPLIEILGVVESKFFRKCQGSMARIALTLLTPSLSTLDIRMILHFKNVTPHLKY